MRWNALINNYEGKRQELASGELEYTTDAQGRATVSLFDHGLLPYANRHHYIIDDGKTVTVMYVVGWKTDRDNNGQRNAVWLQSFPTNDVIRADNGEPANFDTWQFGPRKTYHLKVSD